MRIEVGGRTVEISSPDKVLFPDVEVTKADLARYYERIGETMMPHLRGRLVTMHRYPDGIAGKHFYQKEVPDHFPAWIRTVLVEKEGGTLCQLAVEEPATLVYLAQQGCITPHAWLSRADDVRTPDRLVVDLDPAHPDPAGLAAAARTVREILQALELVPYLMTTGSNGLHLVVPLRPEAGFDEVRALARGVAQEGARRQPDLLTVEQRKDERRGRIFVDTLRNGYAQTAVPPYAVRARPGAPVATPLDWDELGPAPDPRRYRIANIFRRLAQKEDPWREMERSARPLAAARARLDELLGTAPSGT